MRHAVLLTVLLLGIPPCQAQRHSAPPSTQAESPASGTDIVIGTIFTSRSDILGEARAYRVLLPPSYETSPARYPVVYVLDGDAYYLAATSAVRALAGLGAIPDAIVVAVTSPDRRTDMTPPEVDVPGVTNRGGDAFLAYLADELIPLIDQQYRTLPLRLLIGHSHGGLFDAYALYARPEAFRWHLAIDAPLHLDGHILEKNIERFLVEHPHHKGRLSTVWNRYDWTAERWQQLVARADQGFRAMTFDLPGETHSSMYYPALYQGLKQLFFDYEYVHDSVRTMEEIDQRYNRLADEYGFEVRIPLWALRYGALEHLVSADPARARPFVERLARKYGETQVLGQDARAWLEELMTNPPAETRADYVAREDATVDEIEAYFGAWSDGDQWSVTLGREDGRVVGTIRQRMPDGQVLTSSIEKTVLFEDGSFEWTYANGMPPRSGLIAYHVVPVDTMTLQVKRYFKIHTPSNSSFGRAGDVRFTLKRIGE